MVYEQIQKYIYEKVFGLNDNYENLFYNVIKENFSMFNPEERKEYLDYFLLFHY